MVLLPNDDFTTELSRNFCNWNYSIVNCAGTFKQSMRARIRLGIGLSYRPARLHMLAELVPWNRFRSPFIYPCSSFVSRVNLSKSFNDTPYLFSKKRWKNDPFQRSMLSWTGALHSHSHNKICFNTQPHFGQECIFLSLQTSLSEASELCYSSISIWFCMHPYV